MLDLILVGEGVEVSKLDVTPGVAGSDNSLITVEVKIPGFLKPREPLTWRSNKEADWSALARELEEPLGSWIEWFEKRNAAADSAAGNPREVLCEAYALWGAIVLGTTWREGSPYGRCSRGRKKGKVIKW